MSENILVGTIRKHSGKGYSKALRRDGKIPGIFYIHGEDSVPLTLEAKETVSLIASKPALISLELDDGSKKEVVVREVQRDPITSAITHIDFMGITRGVKITVMVPVHIVGEPQGIKAGGILEHLTRELEIECLPKHLPDRLDVEVTELEIGDSLHIRDLSYENIRILTREDVPVVNVMVPKVVVVEEVAEVEAEEAVEAEEEVKAEERAKTADTKAAQQESTDQKSPANK